MKNIEKYSSKILDIYSSGYIVAVHNHTNESVKCCIACITCHECLLFNDGTCDISKYRKWLDETYI